MSEDRAISRTEPMTRDPVERGPAHWYLLQCKPNQTDRAREHLDNQGFPLYAPTMQAERLVRRQRVTRDEPVFPGYLFIQLSQQCNWAAVRATRGVSRIVAFNSQPHIVPSTLIEALQQRYDTGTAATPLFAQNDKVRITDGPFRDLEAIVKAVTADERVIVLLNILQDERALAFPVELVAPSA